MITTDNQLIAKILSILNTGFALQAANQVPGYTQAFPVLQKNQPTKEGIPTGPALFLEKLFDRRHGFAKPEYRLNVDSTFLNEWENQVYVSTFQLSARSMQFPDVYIPTASDLLSTAAGFLQSVATVDALQAEGVGAFRVVSNLSNGYLPDDQDRPEASPSLDIVVTYTRVTLVAAVPVVSKITGNIEVIP